MEKEYKEALHKLDEIFDNCEEIDNHNGQIDKTGYRMLPDILRVREIINNMYSKIKQYEED